MADIADFLAGRIYEDEQAAREATEGPWRYNRSKVWYQDQNKLAAARSGNPFVTGGQEFVGAGPDDGNNETTIGVATTGPENDPQSMTDAQHIARYDPIRALAECKAKQGILLSYMTRRRQATELNRYYADNVGIFYQMPSDLELKYLALPYADHPDYQPSWAPPEPGTVETWGRR